MKIQRFADYINESKKDVVGSKIRDKVARIKANLDRWVEGKEIAEEDKDISLFQLIDEIDRRLKDKEK